MITSAESERLRDLSDVIGLQSGKSHQDMAKTSKVLRRHGFNGESKLLSGKHRTIGLLSVMLSLLVVRPF